MTPLLTAALFLELRRARDGGAREWHGSLDLGRSVTGVSLEAGHWQSSGRQYPYFEDAKERTIYYWQGTSFAPAARFTGGLVKLVPTAWGAPTFELDGIKMLPSESISPYVDAQQKVALVKPRAKTLLDCCGGLGYFAANALAQGAKHVMSFERNPDVVWLRSLNPWSPATDDRLQLVQADVLRQIEDLPSAAFDAILHDPPRVSIAAELYGRPFYEQLARVLRPSGQLFHYTGAPQRASHGRDLAQEVVRRLQACGFRAEKALDGVLAVRQLQRGKRP